MYRKSGTKRPEFMCRRKGTATVASDHQWTKHLEGIRSEGAFRGRFFYSLRSRPHWTDWTERLGKIHIAADSGGAGRARWRRSRSAQKTAAQLRGTGVQVRRRSQR